MANCRNDKSRVNGLWPARSLARCCGPDARRRIESTSLDSCVETDIALHIVLASHIGQVSLDFGLWRILSRPAWIWTEGQRYKWDHTSQQHPGYSLSLHVPPTRRPFSRITKLVPLPSRSESMATVRPEMPAPISPDQLQNGFRRP